MAFALKAANAKSSFAASPYLSNRLDIGNLRNNLCSKR